MDDFVKHILTLVKLCLLLSLGLGIETLWLHKQHGKE